MVLLCKSGLCPHISHTSSPLQSHPWFTECSPTTGKKVKQHINTLHMANYCPNFRACTLLMQVPYVPKCLPGALSNIRHLNEWSTSSEGGAVSHSAIKCCKKHKYKIQCCMLPSPGLVLCPSSIPNKVGVNQMWYSHNKEWNGQRLGAIVPMTAWSYAHYVHVLHYYCLFHINTEIKEVVAVICFSICKLWGCKLKGGAKFARDV